MIVWLGLCLVSIAAPETVKRAGVSYLVWKADAKDVRIVWKDGKRNRLRDFPSVKRFVESRGETPLMLMNGGIFEPGGVPSGVLVQEGKQLLPVNRKPGKGNFFLKPNGVFLISEKGARVVATENHPPKGEAISYAVQSGPLLLQDGKTHPAFNKGSDSRLLRNGVGVTKDGKVIFAISKSDSPVWPNLWGFADLFRSLGCENALFLDGTISEMRFGESLGKRSSQFGSTIVVVE